MIDHFRELFAYNAWANRRVWSCIERLSDDQFTQPLDYSVGSLRTQVLHTLGVQSWWVHFLRTGEVVFLDHDAFPDRAAIRTRWDTEDRAVMALLDGLTDDDLAREVNPTHWQEKGRPPSRIDQALTQIINHSTDHRAQTLAGIHALGGETVAQDYIVYVWERAGALVP